MRYLILIVCIFLISGCASKYSHERPVDYVTVIASLPDCKKPEKIKLDRIDSSKHIGSTENTSDIDEVIIALYTYSKQLEETVACYEKRRFMLESNTISDTIGSSSKEEKKEE